MITYEWSIKTLEHKVSDGGVIVAHWSCLAQENEHLSCAYGSESFTPDPNNPDFIPYDQLTEDDVLGWVWTEVDKAHVESKLEAQIEEQKTPQTTTGVPW